MGRASPLSKPTRSRSILASALALVALTLAYFGSRLQVSYRTSLTGCAREHGTGDAGGLFLWAGRIGIPVRLLEIPLWEASESLRGSSGNCILTMGNGPWSPSAKELEPAHWQITRGWLALGNTLILVTSRPRSLPPALRRDLDLSSLEETGPAPTPAIG